MNDERKPTFAMFKNSERKTDRSPEYNLVATCPHCGTELKGAGWRKTSGKGTDYVGGPVEVKGEYKPKAEPAGKPGHEPPGFDDPIPF
jgi:hypothetical protein